MPLSHIIHIIAALPLPGEAALLMVGRVLRGLLVFAGAAARHHYKCHTAVLPVGTHVTFVDGQLASFLAQESFGGYFLLLRLSLLFGFILSHFLCF